MKLTPGQRLILSGEHVVEKTIVLPSGVRVESDPRNPLVWRRGPTCARMFYFAGEDIQLAGDVDLDCQGGWPGHVAVWSFEANWGEQPYRGVKRRCIVRDSTIFSSSGMAANDGRDVMAMVLNNDSDQPSDLCGMVNVRTALPIQTSGAGSGPGHRRFRWTNVHGRNGHAAGVAASSLSDPSTDGRQTVFDSCVVEYSSFDDCFAFGLFAGQDRESPPRDVTVRNLLVRDSRFHLAADGAAFQFNLLLRAGRAGSFSAAFRRCVLDASHARGEARFVHCATPAALAFSDCLFVGDHANHISHAATLTQHNNRQLIAGVSRPYTLAQLPAPSTGPAAEVASR